MIEKIRFRNGEGELTTELSVDLKEMEKKIEPIFKKWCLLGMAPRDFNDWLQHTFYSLAYDYEIKKSFGKDRLGGCQPLKEWLEEE